MSAVLAQYQSDIATVPALVAQQTELNDSIALIDTLSQAQGSSIEGVTLDKETVLDSMIVKALQVAGQLKAYASVINDNTLRVKATISRNTFMEKRDDLRDDVAAEIHDLANTNLRHWPTMGRRRRRSRHCPRGSAFTFWRCPRPAPRADTLRR